MTAKGAAPGRGIGPKPRLTGADPASAALVALLDTEAAIRGAKSTGELDILAANEIMRLAGARQVFVLERAGRRARVRSVSSLTSVDPNAPVIQEIERLIARAPGLGERGPIDLAAFGDAATEALATYPFREVLWVPFDGGEKKEITGALVARESPWTPADGVVLDRLAGTIGHARQALTLQRHWLPAAGTLRKLALAAALAVGLLLVLPVPMTVLAPFEVGSSDSTVVAAPIDGVIDSIAVEPNATVRRGDVLAIFNDTGLRNRLDFAAHEVEVARAKLIKTSQLAFSDVRGRHELAISKAELELKMAELAYAREMLDKTTLKADRDGIAVFTDKRELAGRPVETGFRLMEIANPERPELRIDVAVADAIALDEGARIKAFFDADPLRPRQAALAHADYLARERPGGIMAFRAIGSFTDEGEPPPRLGARGTAQISGARVALGYFLFRRPISALRQRFGL